VESYTHSYLQKGNVAGNSKGGLQGIFLKSINYVFPSIPQIFAKFLDCSLGYILSQIFIGYWILKTGVISIIPSFFCYQQKANANPGS